MKNKLKFSALFLLLFLNLYAKPNTIKGGKNSHISIDLNTNDVKANNGIKADLNGIQVIADTITKKNKDNIVFAKGNVVVYFQGRILKSNFAKFDMVTNTIYMNGIKGYANNIFFKARTSKITKYDINLNDATLSTNDNLFEKNSRPEGSIFGKNVRIYPTRAVEGSKLTGFVNNHHLAWFPWFGGSLEQDGPNLFPKQGQDDGYGKYALWGFYYNNPHNKYYKYFHGFFNWRWSNKDGWYLDKWKNRYKVSDDNYGNVYLKDYLLLPKGDKKRNKWNLSWTHHLKLNAKSGAMLQEGLWDTYLNDTSLYSIRDKSHNIIPLSKSITERGICPQKGEGTFRTYIIKGNQHIGKDSLLNVDIADGDEDIVKQIMNINNKDNIIANNGGHLWTKINFLKDNNDLLTHFKFDKEIKLKPAANVGTTFSHKNNLKAKLKFKKTKLTFKINRIMQDKWETSIVNPRNSIMTYPVYNKYSYGVTAGYYQISHSGIYFNASTSNHVDNILHRRLMVDETSKLTKQHPDGYDQFVASYKEYGFGVKKDNIDLSKIGKLSLNNNLKRDKFDTKKTVTNNILNAKLETTLLDNSYKNKNGKLKGLKVVNNVPVLYQKYFGDFPQTVTMRMLNKQGAAEGLDFYIDNYVVKNKYGALNGYDYHKNFLALKKTYYNFDIDNGSGDFLTLDLNDETNYMSKNLKDDRQRNLALTYGKNNFGNLTYLFENGADYNNLNYLNFKEDPNNFSNNLKLDSRNSNDYKYSNQYFGLDYKNIQVRSVMPDNLIELGYMSKKDYYTIAWDNNSPEVNRHLSIKYTNVLGYASGGGIAGLPDSNNSLEINFEIQDTRAFNKYFIKKQYDAIKKVYPKSSKNLNVSKEDLDGNVDPFYKKMMDTQQRNMQMNDSQKKGSVLDNDYTPFSLKHLSEKEQDYFYSLLKEYKVQLNIKNDSVEYKKDHNFWKSLSELKLMLKFQEGDDFMIKPEYRMEKAPGTNSFTRRTFGGKINVKVYGKLKYAWWVGVEYNTDYNCVYDDPNYDNFNPDGTILPPSDINGYQRTPFTKLKYTISHRIDQFQYSIGYEIDWNRGDNKYSNAIEFKIWNINFPGGGPALRGGC